MRFRNLSDDTILGATPNPTANRRIRATPPMSRRKWDDWRCYRCGRWSRAGEYIGGTVTSPIGFTMPYCEACAADDNDIW